MRQKRLITLLAATTLIASAANTSSVAQDAGTSLSTFSELHTPIRTNADTLGSRLGPSTLGLRPYIGGVNYGIDLPFGMNYSRETKSLIMPLDQKNEWGVGLNLNLNSAPVLEQSPSAGLGLQPKRTPGVMLQRKF